MELTVLGTQRCVYYKAAIYLHLIKKNMTPEEKAKELFDKFSRHIMHFDEFEGWKEYIDSSEAKQCALIAVDEIINSTPLDPNFADWDDCGGEHRYWYDAQKTQAFHYWQEVKKEIENL
jgi:hypothetical protein